MPETWLRLAVEAALSVALPEGNECQVSLVITDDEAVRRLNRDYRGLDEVTDLLSFSASHEGSDKIYFVVEGNGLFQIGEDERELGKNEIALAPSGQRHGVSNPGPGRLMLLVFMAPKPSH